MGTLVRFITAASLIGYGVNIFEQSPPGTLRSPGAAVVGVVVETPWGAEDEVTDVSSSAELFDLFAPPEFGNLDSYPGLKAFINKTFPRLKVVRVGATGAAASTFDFVDVDTTASVTATAAHKGVSGDLISVEWVVNATDATARDAIVTIGTAYSRTYESVATTTPLAVNDPGDPFVTFTAHANFVKVPAAIAATALAGGSDGSAVSGDYVGGIASNKGIRLFYGESVDVDVLFTGEVPDALVDAVNDGLELFAAETDKGVAVLNTVAAQSKSAAATYVADYRDDRLIYPWPKVKTTNSFDPDRAVATVNGNSFAAALIAQTDPEKSPGGASGISALKGIVDLEDNTATFTDLDTLNAAGIAPFFNATNLGGFIMRKGVTTSLTPGLTKISRRRMTDFVLRELAAIAEFYAEEPLDVDLTNSVLGPNTSGPLIGGFNSFLDSLLVTGAARIREAAIDPFSGNTQAQIDAGQWTILIAIKLFSSADAIVLKANVGEAVNVAELAA